MANASDSYEILENAYVGDDRITRDAALTDRSITQGIYCAELTHRTPPGGALTYTFTAWVIIHDSDNGQPVWVPEPPQVTTDADEVRRWLSDWLDTSYAAATNR